MAAVTLAAPPPGQMAIQDIAGTALHVRFIPGPKPDVFEFWIPATELDVLAIDSDPLVDPKVLADPHAYHLNPDNHPVPMQGIGALTLSVPASGSVTITLPAGKTAASGDGVWLGATSNEVEPKSGFISQDVTVGVTSVPLVLSVPPFANYTLLALWSDYRPTFKQNVSFPERGMSNRIDHPPGRAGRVERPSF